jgi:hypothetical protein
MAVGHLGLPENVGSFCDGLQSNRSRSDVSYFLSGFEDRPVDRLSNYPADQPLF